MKHSNLLLVAIMLALFTSIYSQDVLRFAVISDTHFENNYGQGAQFKVPHALKNLTSKTPLIDAVFVVGDITDSGREDQYDLLLSCFNNTENIPSTVSKYYLMGNHDNYSNAPAASYFKNKTGQHLHQYIVIKGYPFITISQTGTGNADYNAEAQNFLKNSLADAANKYPDKPIFVFTHVPPYNTCYGSRSEDGWGSTVFPSILQSYPQVIVFSGHSHYPLGDPRSIHQDKFTSINDGSVTYGEIEKNVVDEGIHPQDYVNVTEGVIVNVLENGDVEIERWDTYRNEEILPRWTVRAPHDGSQFTYTNTRNGLPAPTFSGGVKPIVTYNEGQLSCSVSFPQAMDNEVVFRYQLEVLDGNSLIASYSRFSQFYLNSAMPGSFTTALSNLPPNKTLSIRVKAFDSYSNGSEWIESEPFATDEQSSAPIAEFEPTLYYSFDNSPDFSAPAIGISNLLFYDKSGNNSVGIPGDPPTNYVEGPYPGKKAVTIAKDKHVKVLNTTGTSDGGGELNTYTLLYDIKFDTPGRWYSLLQTNMGNTNDGEIFIRNSDGRVGLSATGYSTESLNPNQWYRLIITLNGSDNPGIYNVYLNGNLILNYKGEATAKDGRFSIGDAFLIFTDDDGEEDDIDCAGFAFWGKRALTPEQIALLGTANIAPVSTSIDDIEFPVNERLFYPNPAYDILHLNVKSGIVSFCDLLGKEILSTVFEAGEVNISSLKPGTYVLRISANNSNYRGKLIKY